MTDEQKKNLADGKQVSIYFYDEQHDRMVASCRKRSALHPKEPTCTVSQFIREAIEEKLDREKP